MNNDPTMNNDPIASGTGRQCKTLLSDQYTPRDCAKKPFGAKNRNVGIVVGSGINPKNHIADTVLLTGDIGSTCINARKPEVVVIVGEESKTLTVERYAPLVEIIPRYAIDYKDDNRPWHDRFKNNHRKRR